MPGEEKYFKGRGAQTNQGSRFNKNEYVAEHIEGLDEPLLVDERTHIFHETSKTIVNKVASPDVGMEYSMNPYQGCEHGCIYCYARNTHQYWGYSAGLDFERKIIVKKNAAELLEKFLQNKNWKPYPIFVSGNTDCYQPVERELRITRSLLEVFLKYRHPLSMITKNTLILRDLDILKQLSENNLVHVMVTITSLKEEIRLKMEPRTATARNRLKVIETLAQAGIPVGVMIAPIIPGLTSDEIPAIMSAAGNAGASAAGKTIVRLNGAIGDIFKDWLFKNFPDAAEKVWHHICQCHGGNVNDSEFGRRMRGEGKIAESIDQLFKMAKKKYIKPGKFEFDLTKFKQYHGPQLSIFEE